METLWIDDPTAVLLDSKRATQFFPAGTDGPITRANAFARFVLYSTLVLVALRGGGRRAVPVLVTGALALLVMGAWHKRLLASERPGQRPGQRPGDGGAARQCTRPTEANPFANVLLSEYEDNPGRMTACDITDPKIGQQAEAFWRRGLYQPTSDVYNRTVSSRQFYTTASTTIPNDQSAFANALYKTAPTFKEGALEY
jgi:hypothetical protein